MVSRTQVLQLLTSRPGDYEDDIVSVCKANSMDCEGKNGDERKPIMEIDGHGIGHAFCLSELGNQVVAKKCADWISRLV